MYGNLSRRVIKPQYLRQLGRSVGRSMRGTSFRSAVGSGRRRAASVTRRKKVTLPTKKRSTELIEEADHHKLGQPCVQDENRDKSNTKQAPIDESSLTRKEEKEEVKINSTTRTETVEKMKFHDEVEREGNNFEGKQEKGKNERSSSKTSKKKANMSGSEDEYEEWFDIIHHLADHGMKEMKHLQKHLARQEAKNTFTPSVANSSLLLKKKNCQRSSFAVRSEKQCIKKCLSEKITKKNKIQSLSDSSLAIGASLQVVSKNPWEYEGVDFAVRKGPCGSYELATFVPVGGVVTYNGQFQKGCGATWVSVTTRRDGIRGYIPSVYLREINPTNGNGAMCKPVVHPKFSQCDKGWGYDKMSSKKTLCHGGCVVSAIASALALRKKIGGADATPGTLNAWLKANKGYLKDDLVNFNALAPLGLKFDRFTKDENDIKTSLCAGDVVLLNVRAGKHWVLGEGVQGREYFVVDSSYAGNTYSFIDVEGAVILAKV